EGEIVLLEGQDRSRWDRAKIAEGLALVQRALAAPRLGPYAIQAAIAGVHAQATSAVQTDWNEIVGLYDVLLRLEPTPIVELNRAAALAMRDGPGAGIEHIDALFARGELRDYLYAHTARAELCRRAGRMEEAVVCYREALALARQEPERRLIERRLEGIESM